MSKSSKTGHKSNPWGDPRDPLPKITYGSKQYEMVGSGPGAQEPGLVSPHKRNAGQPTSVPKTRYPG